MCGIFGIISDKEISLKDLKALAAHSQQRGMDSSGLFFTVSDGGYGICRADTSVTKLLGKARLDKPVFAMGHSRLITNGLSDNQPVYRDNVCLIHNGIVVNHDGLWANTQKQRKQEIDTEIIAAIIAEDIENHVPVEEIHRRVLNLCKGIVACAVALPRLGKLSLFSNNGSLYLGKKSDAWYFASEEFPLKKLGCLGIQQVRSSVILDIPMSDKEPELHEINNRKINLIPELGTHADEERLLVYFQPELRRCTKCILPETMPFINFDEHGVCNYCRHYKTRNKPRPVEEIFKLVEGYRRKDGDDCIVPFSGGRDSCYGLHLIVNELKMKPITYTYDWGMVTDLGRRNISRMSAALGVENIIVAADIDRKRKNIAMNLQAWLKSPHLGMISILTAGDKHFFRYVETIKEQTGISLNLWGVNPLEVTHFKAGFLGIPPYFEEERVYSHGAMKQLRYQSLRFKAMLKSPGYFNSSLWDTLSGEYYRSFTNKSDYYHIFDYWRWDEKEIDRTLAEYDWELAPDTKTTWRIGDGTAAFYNYVYHAVAGFTEHDTFRSNQIREGDLTRDEALEMVMDENRPRYPNIKWYLDAVGIDFKKAISVVNSIPKIYAH
jgi:glucosamine--fructose-6-phosphate aminotransferase (isomerizing)